MENLVETACGGCKWLRSLPAFWLVEKTVVFVVKLRIRFKRLLLEDRLMA